MASINNQWPVITQMQTMVTDNVKATNSAGLKRPHVPNEILEKEKGESREVARERSNSLFLVHTWLHNVLAHGQQQES